MGDSGVLQAKLTAMAVLGTSSLVLGLLPIKLSQWLGWNRPGYKNESSPSKKRECCAGEDVLSCLLCGGAGVLLCTTLVHLLPEVRRSSEKLVSDLPAPLCDASAELLMCAGFFLMYLVEELVHVVLHRRHRHHHHVTTGSTFPPTSSESTASPTSGDAKAPSIQDLQWVYKEESKSHVNLGYSDGNIVTTEVPVNFRPTSISFAKSWGGSHSADRDTIKVDIERPAPRAIVVLPKASPRCHKLHHDHSEMNAEEHTLPEFMSAAKHHSHVMPLATASSTGGGAKSRPSITSPMVAPAEPLAAIRGLLIVMALSVHELFEGLAVGLEEKAAHVWYMMGAVACHKLVIAFCIGVELVSMHTRTFLVVLYVGTFAVVSPIGIAVGVGVSISEGAEEGSAALILQGLSSGTLLYVIFFEILERQRACGSRGLRQFVSVLTGFVIMLGLAFFGDGHDHDHHDHHDHDHDHDHHHHHHHSD